MAVIKRLALSLSLISITPAMAFTVDSTHQKVVQVGPAANQAAYQAHTLIEQNKEVTRITTVTKPVQVEQPRVEQKPQPSPYIQLYAHTVPQYAGAYSQQVVAQAPLPVHHQANLPPNTLSFGAGVPSFGSAPQGGFTQLNASSAQALDRLAVSTTSSAVAVVDLQTGQTIYGKNVDTQRSIASISKLMTAMVLFDAGLDMGEEITLIGSDLVGAKRASTNLKAGDRLRRAEFILMMLMKSENPAAKALARTYPGGYDAFIHAMNVKAQSLGMTKTSFADSSGLNPKNVSTPADLVRMTIAINNNPNYRSIRVFSTAKSYDFKIRNYQSGDRTYRAGSTNRLVHDDSNAIAMQKTGFIREAGYCVVMETNINGRPSAVVLLGAGGSNQRWNDAQKVLTQLAFLR